MLKMIGKEGIFSWVKILEYSHVGWIISASMLVSVNNLLLIYLDLHLG